MNNDCTVSKNLQLFTKQNNFKDLLISRQLNLFLHTWLWWVRKICDYWLVMFCSTLLRLAERVQLQTGQTDLLEAYHQQGGVAEHVQLQNEAVCWPLQMEPLCRHMFMSYLLMFNISPLVSLALSTRENLLDIGFDALTELMQGTFIQLLGVGERLQRRMMFLNK